ncbi:MAG: preprotein translocase subunit SecG [Clostridia bacterium]|nr:preprotein translocase subunit SecG [Clostridia bacterium]
MEVLSVILGVLLILVALAIIAAVLLQSSKNARQSGVVSGGAEAFFGKSKGKAIDRKLNRITLVLCLVFAALVITMYIVQPEKARPDRGDSDQYLDDAFNATTTVTTTVAPADTTTADPDDDSAEDPATTTTADPATTTEDPSTTTTEDASADTPSAEEPSAGEQ